MYSTSPPIFVAVDLASVTTLEPAGLRRCLDTVFTAADWMSRPPPGPPRDSLRVFGVLERVLVAHVTCDPFVAERRGTRDLLRWLSSRRIPIAGTAAFTPAVAHALARRFGWSAFGVKVLPCDGLAWDAIAPAARAHGVPAERVAYLADDRWELAHAAKRGCGMTFDLSTVDIVDVAEELRSRIPPPRGGRVIEVAS
jgi:hypothetical protein